MTLEPKNIPLSKYKDLVKDSFELMFRKPIAFMLLTTTLLLLSLVSNSVPFMGFVFNASLIVFCGVGTLIAEAADLSKNPIELILKSNKSSWINQSIIAVAILAAGILMFAVIYLIALNYPVDKSDSEPVVSTIKHVIFPAGAEVCLAMGLCIILFTHMMLSLPCLLANLNVELVYAIRLANKASNLNVQLSFLMAVIYLITAVIGSYIGVLVFLAVPFFMCFMYVLYRSVYLNKDGNEPAKKRAESLSLATA